MMESKKIINMLDTKYSAPNTIHQVNQLNLEQKIGLKYMFFFNKHIKIRGLGLDMLKATYKMLA